MVKNKNALSCISQLCMLRRIMQRKMWFLRLFWPTFSLTSCILSSIIVNSFRLPSRYDHSLEDMKDNFIFTIPSLNLDWPLLHYSVSKPTILKRNRKHFNVAWRCIDIFLLQVIRLSLDNGQENCLELSWLLKSSGDLCLSVTTLQHILFVLRTNHLFVTIHFRT